MIDEIFHYRVKANSFLAKCRVRVNCNTVVATELPDNTGMSITNAAELEFGAKKMGQASSLDPSTTTKNTENKPAPFFQAEPPEVAMLVCQFYEIPIAQLVWIEHYPQTANINETYDAVEFEIVHNCFANPIWKPISRTRVEELVGCLL